jgi:hypothetical protein
MARICMKRGNYASARIEFERVLLQGLLVSIIEAKSWRCNDL